ncbi:golgin subfamily A member 6-like protein 22 [Palaemon carinicauda]|uniref:golgin subfamily A member 6-like protein 22 n=1 Tax=Palaemon carinicauda TaxID=392227 RepID=UPI0035B6AA88
MALTIGFLVSNGVLTVRSPFKKLLDWFAGCYGNESGCSMDTLLVGLNKELDNCSISEMEEWVADQKEISSLENSTSNSNDDEEEGRKDCQQNDLVKEVYAYQQKLGEINDQMSNLDDDLLQRDQELASFRQKADQDKRKNDELRTKTLSRERKFQEVQEENDSLRKEVSRLRESQLQREEDKLSTQGFEDKQKADLEGKPQDERKHLRREAKEEEGQLRGQSQDFRENLNRNAKNMSLARITQIIEKELSEQNENVWKSDNIEKELKEYQEANSLRTDGDSATKGDDYAEIRRVNVMGAKQKEKELSEQNENVWKSDNIEKELKEYQEANSLRTDGDSATKGDDYAEIRRVNVMGAKQKGDLEGKPQDERKHLRREAKEVALRRIQKRELLRREEESKRLNKELIEERRIKKETESEVHSLKKEIKSLKQRLLAKTGQIGDTHKVVMELADLMNQLKEEVNSDD